MQIHLLAVGATDEHTTFRVFVNSASAGLLTMRNDEARSFHQIVSMGCQQGIDEFRSSGRWGTPAGVANPP